jgi:hypothetical protein
VYFLESVIHDFEEGEETGELAFPFTFKLPIYCPSTFKYEGHDLANNFINAAVDYFINVSLISKSGEENLLTHTRDLVIRNRHSRLSATRPIHKMTAPVSNCCLSKGSVTLKLAMTSSNIPAVDDSFTFKLNPDNLECSAAINHVISKVYMDATFMLNNFSTFKVRKELFHSSRPTWISENSAHIYEKDFDYLTRIDFTDMNLNPSSNDTKHIKCSYTIEVLIFYNLLCKRKPVVVTLPFQVNPKYTREKSVMDLPRNWNPVEVPIKNLLLNPIKSSFIDSRSSSMVSINGPDGPNTKLLK